MAKLIQQNRLNLIVFNFWFTYFIDFHKKKWYFLVNAYDLWKMNFNFAGITVAFD